jgi:hypothetical protein
MNNQLDLLAEKYLTTLSTAGADLIRAFSDIRLRCQLTFDGQQYTKSMAQRHYMLLESGHGVFIPTQGIVPGRLIWCGRNFRDNDSGSNFLCRHNDLQWIDFQSLVD